MRVFVLGTGRCGTVSFARACDHLDNFTAGHETRAHLVGDARFAYDDDHIEVDNRLSWFLGELGERFPDAFYVHLRRDPEAVARSFLARWPEPPAPPPPTPWRPRRRRPARPPEHPTGIIGAFAHAVVMRAEDWPQEARLDVCRFYVRTVVANVERFVSEHDSMTIDIDGAAAAFPRFAARIGATGDLDAAAAELTRRHNRTGAADERRPNLP